MSLAPISLCLLLSLTLVACTQVKPLNDEIETISTQHDVSDAADIRVDIPSPSLVPQQNIADTIDIVMAARYGHIQTLEQALLQGQALLSQRDVLGNTALIAAAANGHEDIVVFLIENHVDVNARANDGSTALMIASQNGNESIVNRLLLAGAYIEQLDNNGENALFYAIRKGHITIVNILLSHEANPNILSKKDKHAYRGYTPLMFASSQNRSSEWFEIVSALLDYGAEPNIARVTGETALSMAQVKENHEIVGILSAIGASSDKGHYASLAPEKALVRASSLNDIEKVQIILTNSANPNSDDDGVTPLLVSSAKGHNDVVRLLVEQGANINQPGTPISDERLESRALPAEQKALRKLASHGDTPLISAIRYGNAETVDYLLESGANYNLPNTQSETPGLVAARTGDADIMGMLITRGMNPDDAFASRYNDYYIAGILRQEKARALLIEAALNDHANTVQVIVEKGGNVNVADQDGRSALSWASEKGFIATAKMLLEYNSDVDKRDNLGRTSLMYAAIYGHEKLVTLLLSSGANINAVDGEIKTFGVSVKVKGESALIHAARSGHIDVVRLLLERGAEKSFGRSSDNTAVDVARENGHIDIAKLIAGYK